MLRRLFCLFSAFAVLFFVSTPAFATGMEIGGAGAGIPIVGNINLDVVDFMDYCRDDFRWSWNSLVHLIDEEVCPYAPQVNGGHVFHPVRTLRDGQVGLYYQCEYCGKAYGEALEEAYQEYIAELPGRQYTSDGAYWWTPDYFDFGRVQCKFIGVYNGTFSSESAVKTFTYDAGSFCGIKSANVSGVDFSVAPEIGSYVLFVNTGFRRQVALDWGYVTVPVAGFYSITSSFVSDSSSGLQSVPKNAGDRLSLGSTTASFLDGVNSVSVNWPCFLVAPYEGGGLGFDMSTRVSGSASNGGAFGYVENGQLYQSTVGTIYNEVTNVYQNPVTGDTSSVSSWVYDYNDRSYMLTTTEGDRVTITYGDSNVTIEEGDVTYNVYYLMEETEDIRQEIESRCVHDYASALTTPPTCTASGVETYTCAECGNSYTRTVPPTGHNYQSVVTMAPTCANTGVRMFACSECGDNYTVSIAATGHTWEVISTVPTTYDSETGQLVQAGYTLYECSVCHEQYRIDADSGGSALPSPSSGGTSTGGSELVELDSSVGRGFLATIAHGLTDDLPEVLKAASEWFTTFPQFYSGFMTFVKEGIAGCLPDVPRMMMGFGFGMTTLIGIVRKIIGR